MLWMTMVFSAFAGPHRPLCEKIEAADLVIEIAFKQVATYPEDYRQKQWAPPQRELDKTLATGTVETVFKGSVRSGQAREPTGQLQLNPGGSTAAAWSRFLSMPDFKQIAFLKEEKGIFASTGWAEESAPCGSSAHRSWCADYADFQRKIQQCLSPEAGGEKTTVKPTEEPGAIAH